MTPDTPHAPATPYCLLETAGQGAAGTVYKARRGDDGPLVALKIAKDDQAIVREALYAAFCLSPHIPQLLDLGVCTLDDASAQPVDARSERTRAFVALAWCDGDRPAGGQPTALRVARDVAAALADLHACGLAHGDVKPANVVMHGGRASLTDLGLVSSAFDQALPIGGTPRYLARGDAELGDGRARDLLALGLTIAEVANPAIAAADEPLVMARRSDNLPEPLRPLIFALLAPQPTARPSARWVSETAANLLNEPPERGADAELRSLRAAYIRTRSLDLARAHSAGNGCNDWASELIALFTRARAIAGTFELPFVPTSDGGAERHVLEPLDAHGLRRWLTAAVGYAASSWPLLVDVSERQLTTALTTLAEQRPVASWTFADVASALRGDVAGDPSTAFATDGTPLDASAASRLAIALSRTPADAVALATVERLAATAPIELVQAAITALRQGGQLGRARALLEARPEVDDGIRATLLRRCGEVDAAARIVQDSPSSSTARAVAARIALDRGDIEDAIALLPNPAAAAECEVAALAWFMRNDTAKALGLVERGAAAAGTNEERARLEAMRGYVLRWSDPPAAAASFSRAAQYAARAGAAVEEATYRTGLAAASVDLGELAGAVQSAERAAVLFDEALDSPGMTARAWLAIAAANAAVGNKHDATRAAQRAIHSAELGGDKRAQAFAWWTIADASTTGDADACDAAARAAAITGLSASDDDAVHSAARLWLHQRDPFGEDGASAKRDAFDNAASDSERDPFCRLAWWEARATHGQATDRADATVVITRLASLADARVPVASLARAMYAGAALAEKIGDTDALARFEQARQGAAARIRPGDELAEAARSCRWLAATRATASASGLDLSSLIGALTERRSLRTLLDRVLDALLLWTGAERGLLLMRSPGDALVPRAARGIGRDALDKEQLELSSSLAQRALESGEPVVAIDAIHELGDRYASVHALGLRSVLAVPLASSGETLGVVYLDDRLRRGVFGEREIAWVRAAAPVAALAIIDARTQVNLRRAVKRAERSQKKLEVLLAKRQTALYVAERELARTVGHRTTRFRYDDIVGESPPMQKLFGMIDRVAVADVPVLIFGESGSGKELVARAVHRNSARAEHPFVSENCGALPESLLESALFGHVRGAFTGAHRTRIGLFEAADEGTLFLDEVGEMSLGMQAKLLRVLEDSLVRPVGSERARKVNVRVVAATNRDLEQMVEQGSFRQDLFYRLNVICLHVPSLRERPSDIPLLVAHMLAKHASGRKVAVTRAALELLRRQRWPGNVRQLENEVRRALLLAEGDIDVDQLSVSPDGAATEDLGLNVRGRIDHLECDLVAEAMTRTGGNQTQAAKLLGISRYGLHKMIKRLGLVVGKRAG